MIQLLTLGAADLRRDGAEVRSVLSQPKRLVLLVHIALDSPSGYVGRDTLLARFWPESDAERARNSLRQALHYLRRSLGEQTIVSRGDRELGVSPEHVRCDAAEFEAALREGRLEAALELYRGDFLPGMHVEDAPELDRWIDERRAYYRRRAVEAALALADRDAAAGEERAALLWARRAVGLDAGNETATRRLMKLLEHAGEPAAALNAFHELEARLRADLALGASEETVRLASAIRRRAGNSSGEAADAVPASPFHGASPATGGDAATADVPITAGAALPIERSSASEAPLAERSTEAAAVPAPPRPRRRAADRRRPWLAAAIVAAVLAGGSFAVLARRPPPPSLEGPAAIAVLPFLNMSGDPANDYFSDGMTEELLNVLSRLPDLNVAARTSSFAFKGKDVPVDSIGRALSVTHVLEGSVRAMPDRVRITAQLIDTRTGYHLWSEAYDRRLDDVFQVQDEIATAIAKVLQIRLTRDLFGATAAETTDPEAHRLLLQAQHIFRNAAGARDKVGEAAALLEEAVRRDPRYARAHGALANVISWQAEFNYIEREAGYARARDLAAGALRLGAIPEAHLVLARLAEQYDYDQAAAEAHYQEALALNPRDPRTLQFHGLFLARSGKYDEGIASIRRATELDPLHQGAFSNLAMALGLADRDDEALSVLEHALRLAPDDHVILMNLANQYARAKRFDEASRLVAHGLRNVPDDEYLLGLQVYLLLDSGRMEEGRAAIAALEARPTFSRFRLAGMYTRFQEIDRILDLLEEAVDRREPEVARLRRPEEFRGMRHHPRFVRLLERIGAD